MRFYPHSFVTSSKGRKGVLCLLYPGSTNEELQDEINELREMNQLLRQEVTKLRKAVGER